MLEHLAATPPGEPGSALAGVAAVPFGLWLLRSVYRAPGADPAVLLDTVRFPDTATLRTHLLAQLVTALIDIRPPGKGPGELFRPRRRHDPAQLRAWLGYLAHLTSGSPTSGARDLAWWRLAHDTGGVSRTVRFTITIVTTLLVGLTGAVLTTLASGWRYGLTAGLGYSCGSGLVAGAVVGFMAGSWPGQLPGFADFGLRGRLPVLVRGLARGLVRGLMLALVVGIAMGLAVGFATGLMSGLAAGIGFGLAVGLTSGLASGFTTWAESPALTGQASTPQSSWRADRALNVLRTLTIGLTSGLTAGLMTGFAAGTGATDTLAFGFAVGTTNALAFAIAFGFAAGEHHAWTAYLITTWRLARSGRLPRALMPFLDDCHRLGLLRAVGPIYQFRHAELHEHLATTDNSGTRLPSAQPRKSLTGKAARHTHPL